VSALPNITGRPPIVAKFPNGIFKLYCPCGAVLVFNPAVSECPPAQCAFCERRYRWPTTPARVEECGRREVEDESAAVSVRRIDWTSDTLLAAPPIMWVGATVRQPAPQNSERIRSSKRMCVVCCRVKPPPRHEVLRVAIAGIPAQWIFLCDGCLPIYEQRGCIAERIRPNNWNTVNFKDPTI
jgi:hypothetical protein